MMSWKAEVIADSSGEFYGNALRFESKQEAEDYVKELMYRWTAVRETRVVESDDRVTALWQNGQLHHLPEIEVK
jgi:hypothetical protein